MKKNKKILILDNYDSFTYNLLHAIESLGYENIEVIFNNQIDLKSVENFDKIILSPGPGIPKEAGLMMDLLKEFSHKKSILGICLGHQALGEFFGGKLINLNQVFHGIQSEITLSDFEKIFQNLPEKIQTGRYHSWVIGQENFPHEELKITATDRHGHIMAIGHKKYDLQGVQFHPESILTPLGLKILENFLSQ